MGAPLGGGMNPMMAQRLQQLMAARARPTLGAPPPGGAPPMGIRGPAGPGGDLTGQINQQLAGLRTANPQQILQMLQGMRTLADRIFSMTSGKIPGVSRNVAAMGKILDNAIKEASTAMATEAATGPPVANTAANMPAPAQAAPGSALGIAPGPTP